MADFKANIPEVRAPFIDVRTGQIDPVWWQFLLKLFARTGGEIGSDGRLIEGGFSLGNSLVQVDQALRRQIEELTALDPQMVAIPTVSERELGNVAAHGLQTDDLLHAAATPNLAGFLSAADKIKLDGLRSTIAPVSLIADVTAANTTADVNILQMVIPENTLIAGTTLNVVMFADISAAASGGTLSVWIKVGAGKQLILTFTMPVGATSAIGLIFEATLTQRNTTIMQFSASMASELNTHSAGPVINAGTQTVTASISNTFTVGFNWGTANAANIATANACVITQEK